MNNKWYLNNNKNSVRLGSSTTTTKYNKKKREQ